MGGILQVEWNRVQVLTNMVIADHSDPKEILISARAKLIDAIGHLKQSSQPASFDQQERESQIQKIDLELKIAGYKEIIR